MGNEAGEMGMEEQGKREKAVKTFLDLDVYQSTFHAAKVVIFQILPKLPKCEAYDLVDQLRRSVKAIPALIAEGYAKKYQQRGYIKYLVDAIGEANEIIVHLSFAKEYVKSEQKLLDELINVYDIARKQLFNLQKNWDNLDKRRK